jgi:hypothetical protein
MEVIAFGDGYQFVAAKIRPNLSFQELGTIRLRNRSGVGLSLAPLRWSRRRQ